MDTNLTSAGLKNILKEMLTALLTKATIEDPNCIISLLKHYENDEDTLSATTDETTEVGLFLFSSTSDSFLIALTDYYTKLLDEKSRRYYDFYIELHKNTPSAQSKLMLGLLKSMRTFLTKNTNFLYDFETDYKKQIRKRGETFLQRPISFINETFVRLLSEDVTFLQQYNFHLQIYSYDAPKTVPVLLTDYLKSIET